MFMGWIIRSVGTFWANMIMSGFLILGTIVTGIFFLFFRLTNYLSDANLAMITEELRRQKAHEIQAHMPVNFLNLA